MDTMTIFVRGHEINYLCYAGPVLSEGGVIDALLNDVLEEESETTRKEMIEIIAYECGAGEDVIVQTWTDGKVTSSYIVKISEDELIAAMRMKS